MIALDRILERVETCRQVGEGQWAARCPAHDDRVASLSIGSGRTGVLLTCHAGCSTEAVVAALGISLRDLFDADTDATNEPHRRVEFRGQRPQAMSAPVLERLYELKGWTPATLERLGVGFDGERLVFASGVRYKPGGEPKMLALKGAKRELWPAPESLNGAPTWLVEGEPDAVSATELGLEAVSIPGVAKWSDDWAQRFAGRRVRVLLDCDQAGRNAAGKIAAALVSHAADVRLLDLDPGRTDGYDLGDFVREAAQSGDDGKRQARELLERMADLATPLADLERVDTAALLADLSTFVRRYVVLSSTQAAVVALWTLHTHTIDTADTTPYLAVTSAERRSGKTRLLEVLERLVRKPLPVANISDAALFRSLDAERPTLLFDEVDAIFGPRARDREDLRALLNIGYRRGAKVLRVGGANRDRLDSFDVFGAKVFAGIGDLPDTVADRSVPIRLARRAPHERVERFRLREAAPESDALRERAERFAAERMDVLEAARPALPDELDDRAQDVSEPLLAIADLAGGDWPAQARAALVELCAGRHQADDDSLGVRLLADVRDVLGDSDRISTANLLDGLAALDESPWGDWYGKTFTSRALAKLLKPYGIRSRSVRMDDGSTPKGFHREQFESAWGRYLATNTPHRHNPHQDRGNADISSATDSDVWRMENGDKPAPQAECGAVADTSGNDRTGVLA